MCVEARKRLEFCKSENSDKLRDDRSLKMGRGKVKPLLQECSLLVACLWMVEVVAQGSKRNLGEVSKTPATTSLKLSILE